MAIQRQPEAYVLRSWLGLAAGEISFADYYKIASERLQLSYLTIDTTGACDLSCSDMCYYNPAIDTRLGLVSEKVLTRAIDEADTHLDLQTMVLAGKEPFLNARRVFALLRHCGSLEHRSFTVGVVTNGRLLNRHWDGLQDAARNHCLDFLDISIDSGFPSQHDRIRGQTGTFDLAFAAACEAHARLSGVRISVTSILRQDNPEGILELLRNASPSLRCFHVFPIQPPPFVTTQPLEAEFVVAFLANLKRLLKGELAGAGVEITVTLPGLYLSEAVGSSLFEWADLEENHQGACFARKEVEGNSIVYACLVLPEQASRLARITYDGAYLAHLHFLQAPQPQAYAVGYIQEESIVSLYRKAIGVGNHFHQIVNSRAHHECSGRSCWQSCFGGWVVAENAFLNGQTLTAQPRLCPKEKETPH
ncbi:MAG TPA: radical SAM protein [Bryobacteraceae bacterium]|nr:radical SAM protein [Bryobacteraceae bacterium]